MVVRNQIDILPPRLQFVQQDTGVGAMMHVTTGITMTAVVVKAMQLCDASARTLRLMRTTDLDS